MYILAQKGREREGAYSVKDEDVRVNIRNFIKGKISDLNEIIRTYEDETSLIIKEEFPQLTQIREILKRYSEKIQTIKDDVYKTLEARKTQDIDIIDPYYTSTETYRKVLKIIDNNIKKALEKIKKHNNSI